MTATITEFRRPTKSCRDCSFCNKSIKDVAHMFVAGNVAAICDRCLDLGQEMVAAKKAGRDYSPDAPPGAA